MIPTMWQEVKAVSRDGVIVYVALPGDVALTKYNGRIDIVHNGIKSVIKLIETIHERWRI